jgi:hypothetical protein
MGTRATSGAHFYSHHVYPTSIASIAIHRKLLFFQYRSRRSVGKMGAQRIQRKGANQHDGK